VLGAILALLSAATFALNNVAARRGVVSGSPIQGMAISIPVGVACFLPVAILAGEIGRLTEFSLAAAALMAGVGVQHFVFGRFCNYSANQAAGVNLTAAVIQLQVIVTLVLAVVILREPCTVLQMIGGALIVAGSIITQQQQSQPSKPPASNSAATADTGGKIPRFVPSKLKGYAFASLAALAYGSSPIPARFALEGTSPGTGILGGLIAYAAATLVVLAALLWPPMRREVQAVRRESGLWFAYSGVFVAMAQGFFFAAVSGAPVLLVMPLLQMSLVFRLLFSNWLNPDHEVFGALVMIGVATSIAGALMVSIDTNLILSTLAIPEGLAQVLRWRVS
jgi:drug/metabolite transporter (DMT)-like permease